MILTGLFLFNLFCAYFPCDEKLETPEVRVKKSSTGSSLEDGVRDSPMVVTATGGLEGYIMLSTEGRKIFAFEGIPYAEPPIGSRRFQAPVPKKPWLGMRQALRVGPECLQLSPFKLMRVAGDEDCLYLNVYTRQTVDYSKEKRALPVIFYIHGGSYYFGSGGKYGPAYLLNHDLVLVTLNYRLGVLGFLSTGETDGSGNYGLKDQALALKWVSENIGFFGGDPKHVTILGEGSAGASAHLHYMSPLSRDLFRSGISLSGSALTHWAVKSREEVLKLTDKLAGVVGCPTTTGNRSQLIDCFRGKNPAALVSAQYRLLDWAPFPAVLFAPVVEPSSSQDAFLTVEPAEFYREVNSTRHKGVKPWIFGTTSDEGYFGSLLLRILMGEWTLRYKWDELAPAFLDFQHTAKDPRGLANRLAKVYFRGRSPTAAPASQIAQLFGDRMVLHGVFKAITAHSQVAPTYAYHFQYEGKYRKSEGFFSLLTRDWGIGHPDLFYFLNSTSYYPGFKRADKEYQLSHVMTTLMKTFAESGMPLMSTDKGTFVQIWDAVDPKDEKFLRFDRDIRMIPRPMDERYKFWDGLDNVTKLELNLV